MRHPNKERETGCKQPPVGDRRHSTDRRLLHAYSAGLLASGDDRWNIAFKKFWITVVCFIVLFYSVSSATALSVQTLAYDANGNLIDDGELTYTYDQANRLTEVKQGASVIARYWYDENGARVKKQEGLVTTYYVGDMEVRETVGGGTETVHYYKANGERVAKQNSSGTYIILTDHLGSADVITDENGNKIEDIEYKPYGGILAGGAGENKLYTGKEKDMTGLYYYGARYYNPLTTRFTQPDTVIPNVYNPQDLNRYTYVRNNPLKYTDPDGHLYMEGFVDNLAHLVKGYATQVFGTSLSGAGAVGTIASGPVGGAAAAYGTYLIIDSGFQIATSLGWSVVNLIIPEDAITEDVKDTYDKLPEATRHLHSPLALGVSVLTSDSDIDIALDKTKKLNDFVETIQTFGIDQEIEAAVGLLDDTNKVLNAMEEDKKIREEGRGG